MEFKVLSATKLKERDSQYGKMIDYMMVFEDDKAGEMSQKADTPAPKAGDVLEGEITQTNYGPKFKKASKGGFGGGWKQDPETRKEIMRQNALTNAVQFCIAKANMMSKEKGLDYLSGKQVLQVATYFARFSDGAQTIVKQDKDATQTIVGPNEAKNEEVVTSREDDEINLDEIPFD